MQYNGHSHQDIPPQVLLPTIKCKHVSLHVHSTTLVIHNIPCTFFPLVELGDFSPPLSDIAEVVLVGGRSADEGLLFDGPSNDGGCF